MGLCEGIKHFIIANGIVIAIVIFMFILLMSLETISSAAADSVLVLFGSIFGGIIGGVFKNINEIRHFIIALVVAVVIVIFMFLFLMSLETVQSAAKDAILVFFASIFGGIILDT